MVISPCVTSPHCTDYSSLDAILSAARFAGKTGEELAVAIWEFVIDEVEGVYHFWPALARLNGWFVWDAMKLLNSFGWAICGQNANLIATLWRAAGLDSRLVGIEGHNVAEVFYDGGWHLLDGDLKAFHRKHPPPRRSSPAWPTALPIPRWSAASRTPRSPSTLPTATPRRWPPCTRWSRCTGCPSTSGR